ncbi:polysaccharide biosynthesis/export family protein [Bosea caraganae]|nr:polysaccharide biosynthesis/export family protein [Bosea caraganae]
MPARASATLQGALSHHNKSRLRAGASWPARLALLAALAAAAPAPLLAAPDAPPVYRVAPGDRLSILVFGQAELSGESMVDGANTVTVPLIGPVPVLGLSIKEIEQRITQRLAEGYVQKPVVSVRLTEPRPIYVVGDVKTSGSYAFRHGISVIGAVALAGGFTVSEEQAQVVLRTDYLQADERLRTMETTRASLIARRIRLEAQRDGRNALDFGELTGPGAASEQVTQIIKGEQQMLAFQSDALQQQVATLEQQLPKLETVKAFLQDQLTAEKRQLELVQMHLTDYNTLMSSGLARRYTGIELQREEARNRGNIARFSGDISSNDISRGELTIRIQQAKDAYQRQVRTELQDTMQRLAEVEAALPTARATRELRLRQVGFVADAGGAPRRALFVTRTIDQKAETVSVTDDAPLQPGDILRVERLREPDRSAEPVSVTWR